MEPIFWASFFITVFIILPAYLLYRANKACRKNPVHITQHLTF